MAPTLLLSMLRSALLYVCCFIAKLFYSIWKELLALSNVEEARHSFFTNKTAPILLVISFVICPSSIVAKNRVWFVRISFLTPGLADKYHSVTMPFNFYKQYVFC